MKYLHKLENDFTNFTSNEISLHDLQIEKLKSHVFHIKIGIVI